MEFKQVITNFKAKHAPAGKHLGLSLLPLLMKDLVDNGLNISIASGKFYQELAAELFDNENKEMQIDAVDALMQLGYMIPIPKAAEETPKAKPTEARVENGIIKTDHLVDNIPNEDDEGDPFYVAPEDRINLRPEDFEPMEYDEEFCALIGVKRPEKNE